MNTPVLMAMGVVGVSVILTWAWGLLNWLWLRPRRLEKCLRQQGLSGTPYKLFYGDLNDNSISQRAALSNPISISNDIVPRVIPFVHQSVQNYGKNSFIWIGPIPRLNIMDPELIREILIKFNNFQKPITNPLSKLLVTGLPRHEGNKWAKHRKIVNPAFHLEKLKGMVPAFYVSCSEMVSQWEKMASLEREGVCELDVRPFLDNLAADVISRTAFGSSYEEGHMIFELQKEQAELTLEAMQSVYIPGWRFLPTKRNKRMKQIKEEVQTLLRGIINKKLMGMRAGECGSDDDLLCILLESNARVGVQENKGGTVDKMVELSIMEVIEECKVFYLAGQETTSALLAWTMVLLSVHPKWQTLARDEVSQVFGDNPPDMAGLSLLKVVTMILHEVLRLYPPVTTLVRTIQKDTTLGKLQLPSGVQLSLSTLLVHHDKELWGEDAGEFNPGRFDGGSKAAKHHQVSYFPFSWGPRTCIGKNFAMIEAKMAMAMILQRFSFELSPSYVHAPFTVITLQPQHGVQVILHKL